MKRGRKPKIDWELYRPQIEQLRKEGKSLNDVCRVLYEKLGVSVTAARVSQVLSQWKAKPASVEFDMERGTISAN